jgi:hypothetical protein
MAQRQQRSAEISVYAIFPLLTNQGKKVLPTVHFATSYFRESSYSRKNDIDVMPSSDIIRWHLARQVTLAAMVKTADCGLP